MLVYKRGTGNIYTINPRVWQDFRALFDITRFKGLFQIPSSVKSGQLKPISNERLKVFFETEGLTLVNTLIEVALAFIPSAVDGNYELECLTNTGYLQFLEADHGVVNVYLNPAFLCIRQITTP